MVGMLAFSFFGFDLGELLLSIDWNQAIGFLLAAIGGGGVLNAAGNKGWFAGLLERFRGKPAVPAAAGNVVVDLQFKDGVSGSLAAGLRALRELDELFKLARLDPISRRQRFLQGVDALLEDPNKP